MRRLYEKKEILFAVLWIVAYCVIAGSIKGEFGYESIWMLLALIAFTVGILVFVIANHLTDKYGLKAFPKDMKRYLFFIPVFILATGNLWDGISFSGQGMSLLIASLSMALVGFVEEMIFRGFLFKAMLGNGKTVPAIVVSALTFGIGHIVNLFTGQAGLDTIMQVVFAISWGFIFTMVFYKSKSLLPCIIAHAMVDVFSLYGRDNELVDRIYIGATILVALVYCIYLARLDKSRRETELKDSLC